MDSCDFPRTVEEMLEAGWYDKILKKVKRYSFKDMLNSPEELVQDVFLQIIKSDYLARYDPDYRPFEVYIYVLVENLMRKRGVRESTRNGKNIVSALSLEDSVPESGIEPFTAYLEQLDLYDNNTGSVEDRLYVEDIIDGTLESLKEFKANSSVVYQGYVVERDPITVFRFILQGKSVSDIAEIMQTSKQFIYFLLRKIRNVNSMQDFYSEMLKENCFRKKVVKRRSAFSC